MTEDVPVSDVAYGLAACLANLSGMILPITEASVGYRAQLEAAGYSPTIAETIAAQYHSQLLREMVRMAFRGGVP